MIRPVFVDPRTSYRRYSLQQVRVARLVRALRSFDLPIDEVRDVIDAVTSEGRRPVLMRHRARLEERGHTLTRMLETLDDYLERGIQVSDVKGCRIVEINTYVDNLENARRFYETAFGLTLVEERHGNGPRHLMASFGAWPSDQFFLLNLSEKERDKGRVGQADFGLLVRDLDVVHRRALAAGAREQAAPETVAGMPRTSSILDPSGNRINLYEDVEGAE